MITEVMGIHAGERLGTSKMNRWGQGPSRLQTGYHRNKLGSTQRGAILGSHSSVGGEGRFIKNTGHPAIWRAFVNEVKALLGSPSW